MDPSEPRLKFTTDTIDFAAMTDEELHWTLGHYRIALTKEEILKIQKEILRRPPSLAECVLWSIQGSEHSSYKSSRPWLKQFPVDAPNVILGPKEDAGIVAVATDRAGRRYGIVVSHESHNHPSQVVPYEGAATGIGGNVRDVSCMGAKVVANADPLRFGDIGESKTRWIQDGVVGGIAGYGNPIGIPVIAGDVYYDHGYDHNCLVNVVSLGVVREDEIIHSAAPPDSAGYNLILVGKPTDNSGFGGASFASLALKEEDREKNKGAVQEPNAFLKRHLLKAHYALFNILKARGLFHKVGFKDLGAGGLACAAVELADAGRLGATVNLDLVPRSMNDIPPWVILCSETQERYMWVADPETTALILQHYNATFDLPHIAEGARAAVIGHISADDQYIVTYQGEEIVHAKTGDVTKGLLYERPCTKSTRSPIEPTLPEPVDYNDIFLRILAHENIASREPIFERYDKNVQGITVIEPGEADAGVIQPFKYEEFPPEIRATGVALSVDHNPRYNQIDPYWGAVNAAVEAMRNVAAVGAAPVAITDCLNYGNPEKPEQMWAFVEGTRGLADACKTIHLKDHPTSPTPIISGNVSLYNETNDQPIPPSPVVACIGRLPDARRAITMHLKKTGSLLFLIGERGDECGGSVYYALQGVLGANVPKPDAAKVQQEIWALTEAIDAGIILAAHDISDGGLATTLAEMSFRNKIGVEVEIPGNLRSDKKLFGETGGFVIEAETNQEDSIRGMFKKYDINVMPLGRTNNTKRLRLENAIDIELESAKAVWSNGLRSKL
ncbi:MAG: phosphoribosylformylglycinamidine synthase subunit PurL [Candidatus Magasanikbacteria bacterium]|nr:phosphoribosylformylglycinamidine synthase subunit PurL [Candidatus Magasanikbacteria bacterium]